MSFDKLQKTVQVIRVNDSEALSIVRGIKEHIRRSALLPNDRHYEMIDIEHIDEQLEKAQTVLSANFS